MKASGVIVEYNPLHNGHIYHINETKRKTECDVLIAVMSGNFLQRGEPAFLPKYRRAQMALKAGVDIVVELPYGYATQRAEVFAFGGVSILDTMGAETLSFGSESGKIDEFLQLAIDKEKHEEALHHFIQHFIKKGNSYAKAASLALQKITNSSLDVTTPNNILGMHYIGAVQKLHNKMTPITIKRFGASYHDEILGESIASATAIRKSFLAGEDIRSVVPETTLQIMEAYQQVHHWEQYFSFLQYRILTMTKEELANIYEVEEGLENRLQKKIVESSSFRAFMEKMKTKRYTWTRLQRMCTQILTNTTKEQMAHATESVPYLKLLGMSPLGRTYLSQIKKDLAVPLVVNDKGLDHPLLELDRKATAAYYNVYPPKERLKRIREEWNQPPLFT